MFNNKLKKESLSELKVVGESYEKIFTYLVENIEKLHLKRLSYLNVLLEVENLIESISNKPMEYINIVAEIKCVREDYEHRLEELEMKSKNVDGKTGAAAAVGAAAGVGVGIFGPAAATSIAMTMGTASTGAAISGLSGVAATNAALAWLGGGAIAAGGGGIAAGEAVLAMFGPIGWAIGGTVAVGSGIHASMKNKKIAKEAESNIIILNREIANSRNLNAKVLRVLGAGNRLVFKLNGYLREVDFGNKKDYKEFNDDEKNMLRVIMNSAESLSQSIGEVIEID